MTKIGYIDRIKQEKIVKMTNDERIKLLEEKEKQLQHKLQMGKEVLNTMKSTYNGSIYNEQSPKAG